MGLQALYINEDNLKKLKQEQNMSQLINHLLSTYYGDCRTEEEILKDTKKEIDLIEVKKKRFEEFKNNYFNNNPNNTEEDMKKFIENSSAEFKARLGLL